jgi:hypothetical protein
MGHPTLQCILPAAGLCLPWGPDPLCVEQRQAWSLQAVQQRNWCWYVQQAVVLKPKSAWHYTQRWQARVVSAEHC